MTPKKIAAINFSGNVGKSMLCKHVILPRLAGASLLNIESLNDGIAGGERIRGDTSTRFKIASWMTARSCWI